MSETKWTNEQLAAIETRKCNLLVAAAAGSGKTAVLVERIIRIITNEDNPVDIDRLLVVTFTSAAASEMRERIAGAITKALEKNPNSENLQRQLMLLSRANITTMHSFCLEVIKNNFHVIDLDPSFRILDETEGVLLKGEVIEELFEDKYEKEDKDFLELVEAYSTSKNDNKLKDIVLDLFRFSMSGPWPEKWLREKSEEFNIETLEDLNNTPWINIIKDNIRVELEGLIGMEGIAIDLIEQTQGLEPYMETFQDDMCILKRMYEKISGGIEDLYYEFSHYKFSKLKTVRSNNVLDKDAQDRVKSIRNDIKKKIDKLKESIFELTPEEMLLTIKSSYPFMKELIQLVIEFGEMFSKAKKDKGALDFNDLEHLCLKILSNEESNVANKFKEYFDEVLVDEYQDSNNVQESIINLVSRKYDNNPNVFMVGDVKQSIYRFRQAKPELFLDKYATYSSEEGSNRKIQLYKNFRSRYEVITGVNYIFKELMSKEVGEIEYTNEEALNLGADYKIPEENGITVGGDIELHIVDKFDNKDNIEEEKVVQLEDEEEIGAINREAKIVAERIKQLVYPKENEEKFRVLDKESGDYRPVTFKDIVILLRATKNWSEVFLEELGAEGIPVYADTATGYFESIEIRTIMSLLQVIDNPMQDVPMIALLRSPIMNFSDEELSDIRLLDKEKYFYENINTLAIKEDVENINLKNKCIDFLHKLDKWRERSTFMPIDEFIWYLYVDTSYYGFVGAMPNGTLRQANLRILFQRARQYEKTSFKGLFNFINFINKLRKSSGDMGSAKILGENEDVVRIMSIHKSKGLEFPIVFLCGTGKQFNFMDLNKDILYHEELGLGPEFVDIERRISYSTLPREAIKQRIKLETLSEEMRILYVAFTRAKEKLIITGATGDRNKLIRKAYNSALLDNNRILPSEVLKCKSYLEWITIALFKHRDGNVLRDEVGAVDINVKDDLSTWKVFIHKQNQLPVDKKDETVDEISENNELINFNCDTVDKKIKDKLEYRYKYIESTTLKSNFSVSDLKRKNYEAFEDVDTKKLYDEKVMIKPNFLQEERGLGAAEKGTAMHFVMQKIDLDRINTIEEIKYQLKDMVNSELLSEEEFKVIRPIKILKFFRSNIGKRLLNAYKNGEKIYRELPFYTEISASKVDESSSDNLINEKVRLQGVIDLFFYENNNIVLVDYKTDYVEDGKEDELREKYRIQINYYKEALEKITDNDISECYLYSFYLDREIKY